MDIGQRIKELRTKKGFSQKELGARMNVSQQMIGQYENSTSFPKIETLKKIATALEVDTIELLNFEGVFFEKYNDGITEGFIDCPANEVRESFVKDSETHLITLYRKLNIKGQDKALDQIEMLTKIKEYQKGGEKS